MNTTIKGTINVGNAPVVEIEDKEDFNKLKASLKGKYPVVTRDNGKITKSQFAYQGVVYQYEHIKD
jgi:hypothetical protein